MGMACVSWWNLAIKMEQPFLPSWTGGRWQGEHSTVRPAPAGKVDDKAADAHLGRGRYGNLRDRAQQVHAELRDCEAFVEVSRGRWVLDRFLNLHGYDDQPAAPGQALYGLLRASGSLQ